MDEKTEDALNDYKEKFGDTPTYIGLNNDAMAKIADVLYDAIDKGKPLTDAEFYKKIGQEAPPEDAEI